MYKPNQTNGSFQTSESLPQPTTNNLEEAIEKLAMAITHSEQGEYAKNEEYIREILTDLRKKDMEELIEMLNKVFYGNNIAMIEENIKDYYK
jgi:tyrosine-protein phosphatase YwqE